MIAERIVAVIRGNPGTSWTKVVEGIPGIARTHRAAIRDRLFAEGAIVNVGKDEDGEVAWDHCPERRTARLHPADDPTIQHLRPERGADGAQTAPPGGEHSSGRLRSAPRPIRGADAGAPDSHPAESLLEQRCVECGEAAEAGSFYCAPHGGEAPTA